MAKRELYDIKIKLYRHNVRRVMAQTKHALKQIDDMDLNPTDREILIQYVNEIKDDMLRQCVKSNFEMTGIKEWEWGGYLYGEKINGNKDTKDKKETLQSDNEREGGNDE